MRENSTGVGTTPPGLPWKATRPLPSSDSSTSSTICPVLISKTTKSSMPGELLQRLFGNGHQGDGPQQPRGDAFLADTLYGGLRYTRGGAIGNGDDFGVVEHISFVQRSFFAMTWYLRTSSQLCRSISITSRMSDAM